jgi:MFS superfamily sulfate permease-like transporter
MGLGKHLLNGIISTVISVAVTVAMSNDDDGPWDLNDMVLSVGISSFLSGFFTSYFAES